MVDSKKISFLNEEFLVECVMLQCFSMFVWKHQIFHFHEFKDLQFKPVKPNVDDWVRLGSLVHTPRHCSFALRSLVKRDSLTCDFERRSMPVLVGKNSVEKKFNFRQIESLHLPAITLTHARRSCFAGNFEEKHVQKRHGLDLSDTLVARIEAPRVLLNFVIEYVNSRCVCLGLCW